MEKGKELHEQYSTSFNLDLQTHEKSWALLVDYLSRTREQIVSWTVQTDNFKKSEERTSMLIRCAILVASKAQVYKNLEN